MNEEVEIFVNTSNNVTTALMQCRKLEKLMLQSQLDYIEKQKKKSRSYIDRRKAAFLNTFKLKRKDWWRVDNHVRENVRKDLDHMLIKKANDIIEREMMEIEEAEIKSKKSVDYRNSIRNGSINGSLFPEINNQKKIKEKNAGPNNINMHQNKQMDKNLNLEKSQYNVNNDILFYSKLKMPEIKINNHLPVYFQNNEKPNSGLIPDEDIFKSKSIFLKDNSTVYIDGEIKEKNNSQLSLKLPPIINSNVSSKSPSNSHSFTESRNFLTNSVLSTTNSHIDREYINQMKSLGEFSNEEEHFIETLTRFLDHSPHYVENKENHRNENNEKLLSLKSKTKEKKISQTRDKRFENLINSLVKADFNSEMI